MNVLQNSAFAQRIAAWRRRDAARHTADTHQLTEARFARPSALHAGHSALTSLR